MKIDAEASLASEAYMSCSILRATEHARVLRKKPMLPNRMTGLRPKMSARLEVEKGEHECACRPKWHRARMLRLRLTGPRTASKR